jgi:dephospho-CoA kinase
MKYLIIGRAGSGKSSVAKELNSRNLTAFDADNVPGLAGWENATTGEAATPPDSTFVDSAKFHWNWQKSVVRKLLAEHSDLFLCGGADNDLEFVPAFDRTFVLDVSPEVQTKRLQSQQRAAENSYATHPEMIPIVLAEQKELVTTAASLDAITVNANQPIEKVVDEILGHVHEN